MRSLLVVFIAFYTVFISQFAHAATLTWDASPASEQVTSYTIYKNGVSSGTSTLTSYDLGGVVGDCFHVTAVNSSGESLPSNEGCIALPLPTPPENLTVN